MNLVFLIFKENVLDGSNSLVFDNSLFCCDFRVYTIKLQFTPFILQCHQHTKKKLLLNYSITMAGSVISDTKYEPFPADIKFRLF